MICCAVLLAAFALQSDDLAARLRDLDGRVLPAEQPRMLGRDARSRIEAANQRESQAWAAIRTKADWERYRDAKIKSLRDSLGTDEPFARELKVAVHRTLDGPGHRVENVLFESRPGLSVAANLYVPNPERESMPGIVIVHSHHNPKTQAELQDMGITWARLGCLVLIPDQIGHGERRQHPFIDAGRYPKPFRIGRQDYWYRYNTGLQLQLIGESLMGWMVSDLKRSVDVLLARPGIDRNRIILLGSVAGGGDPAAVAGALDPRIAAVVPFNFGGPQPETAYPLPADAETSFNYAGAGSWESTRNLRLSARDGFLPWVIVGAIAPRRLVYGHEFSWDRERDPVWKRLETIYGFYEAPDRLSAATGRGLLKGQPPEATHCNNIGPVHRKGIYSALKLGFGIPEPEQDLQDRRPAADLACVPPGSALQKVHDLAAERIKGQGREPKDWARVLGETAPDTDPKATGSEARPLGTVTVERILLEPEAGIAVPLLLLLPHRPAETRLPAVIGIAQSGKQAFLKQRSEDLAALLAGGVAVCLPDLRGTGETRPGDGRGRNSESTSVASTELMLGRTLLGLRIRDLRSVLRHLRSRSDLDPARLALWGDSFTPANPPERRFDVPFDADDPPALAEPLGGLAALFGALFDAQVPAVYARGGLADYRLLLDSPYVYVPYDAVVPGALTTVSLSRVAEAIVPRPIRLEGLVDGCNRLTAAGTGERPGPWLLKQLAK